MANERAAMLRGYAICCTSRSGSTLLCQAAASTGVLGAPAEYFNPDVFPHTPSAEPAAAQRNIDTFLPVATTPNGVYGVKVIGYQIDDGGLAPRDWAERLPNLSFVYLYRRDLLRQAISDVRALQTGRFVHDAAGSAEPVYDPERIARKMDQIAQFDVRWRTFFARNGIEPLHVAYETFLAAPQPVLDAIARQVGLEGVAPMSTAGITLRMQRDALTEAWRDRFVAEHRDLTGF